MTSRVSADPTHLAIYDGLTGARPNPCSLGHRSLVVGMDVSDDQVGSQLAQPTHHSLGRVPGIDTAPRPPLMIKPDRVL